MTHNSSQPSTSTQRVAQSPGSGNSPSNQLFQQLLLKTIHCVQVQEGEPLHPELRIVTSIVNELLHASPNLPQQFSLLCQRLLLAYEYKQRNPKHLVATPLITWLDPQNRNGFAYTTHSMANIIDIRKRSPLYRLDLRAFPEAILELAQEPIGCIYQYWLSWFAQQPSHSCHTLFQCVAAAILSDPLFLMQPAILPAAIQDLPR
jgi:hypothetical protein